MRHNRHSTVGTIGTILLVLLLGAGAVSLSLYRFSIYQKKYGSHMTYWDYLLDRR